MVETRNNYRWINSLAVLLLFLLMISCQKDEVVPTPISRSLQVWLHRCNTIAKAQNFQYAYSGLELDVHFDTTAGTFIVKHDASDTSTLTLSTWFGSLIDPGRLGFWLDFKNLSPGNKSAALAELLRIRNAYHLVVNTIVVESSDPSCLPGFDTLNFLVSFYIPYFDPSTLTPEEQIPYRDYIEGFVSEYGIRTISGYNMQHEFMKEYFPQMNKLLWYLDSFNPALQDSVINVVKQDSTVQVLLIAVNQLKESGEAEK
jgi:hypothetical protein